MTNDRPAPNKASEHDEIMTRQISMKDDGRLLIYYRFASAPAPEPNQKESDS